MSLPSGMKPAIHDEDVAVPEIAVDLGRGEITMLVWFRDEQDPKKRACVSLVMQDEQAAELIDEMIDAVSEIRAHRAKLAARRA